MAAGLTLGVLPTAAAAPGSAASPAGPWAPAATAKIHPGVRVTIAGTHCIAGFVLKQRHRVFVTVPASCTGVSAGRSTDGCSEAQVPPGLPVKIQGARHDGIVVYSSFTRMQLTGEQRAKRCENNSLSLIKVDRRDVKRVNPSVPVVGGPTGVDKSQPAAPDVLTVFMNGPTKAQALSTTSGGWQHTALVDGSVDVTAVGSPVLTDAGKALGMVTVVPQTEGGQSTVTDLGRELGALRATPGFTHVHLVEGTSDFAGPSVALLRF
jgi:hypothetical protein